MSELSPHFSLVILAIAIVVIIGFSIRHNMNGEYSAQHKELLTHIFDETIEEFVKRVCDIPLIDNAIVITPNNQRPNDYPVDNRYLRTMNLPWHEASMCLACGADGKPNNHKDYCSFCDMEEVVTVFRKIITVRTKPACIIYSRGEYFIDDVPLQSYLEVNRELFKV